VRKAFFEIRPRPVDSTPSLLVFGGSQGARAINNAVVAALPIMREKIPNLKIVHQTGPKELKSVQQAYAAAGVMADVRAFIDDMPKAFDEADLIVCRSGASTVAEITAAGKTAIFIPLPTAADDHQTKNAEALAKAKAGVLLPQAELTPEKLADCIVGLSTDRAKLREMSENAKRMSHADAAGRVAEIAVGLIGKW
jgi:UDP-N-acetylglucosamine--N-acetylmuramyl-(pentapeptide) pyrophosphoryl-undecaprenol N-acetylglucosamine transferase